MANAKRITGNQNHDASRGKRLKNFDDSGYGPWSNLNHDVLFLIVMQLGIVDFLAFSGVCKSWRSFAIFNREKFLASRKPMSLYISTRGKRACYLDDFCGRKFKTILPNLTGRTCVGITCGYLIMVGRKTHDFLLVNPITRHELHFPVLSFRGGFKTTRFRAILVFSPSLSGWVFLVTLKFSQTISFSLAGGCGCWNHIFRDTSILDLHAFKGKIYAIATSFFLYEVRLNPYPTLMLLCPKNMWNVQHLTSPEFVSLRERLFVMCFNLADVYKAQELDVDKMEWVVSEKTHIEECVFFLNDLKCGAAFELTSLPTRKVSKLGYKLPKEKSRSFSAKMWYFPHDCYNVNLLQY